MRTIVTVLVVLSVLISCKQEQKNDEHAGHDTQASATKYTCAMHPQIVQDKPGNCPICGMTLVEVNSLGESSDLMLSERQMRLANITTQKVGKKAVGETIVINGTLAVDEQKSEAISSRVSGRIEKLFVKETGHAVAKGEPLYVLYSESL